MGLWNNLFLHVEPGLPFQYELSHEGSDYNLSRKEKEAIIISLATNFSYSNAVEETKLKKTENCTEEMEDLFQRMF